MILYYWRTQITFFLLQGFAMVHSWVGIVVAERNRRKPLAFWNESYFGDFIKVSCSFESFSPIFEIKHCFLVLRNSFKHLNSLARYLELSFIFYSLRILLSCLKLLIQHFKLSTIWRGIENTFRSLNMLARYFGFIFILLWIGRQLCQAEVYFNLRKIKPNEFCLSFSILILSVKIDLILFS